MVPDRIEPWEGSPIAAGAVQGVRKLQYFLMILGGFGVALPIWNLFYDHSPPTCRDGWASPSVGLQGACSWHGGVVYSDNSFLIVAGAVAGLFAAVLVGLGIAVLYDKLNLWPPEKPAPPAIAVRKLPDVYPRCPRCDKAMVLRRGPRGEFFGCRRYPKCRGLRPIR